MFERPTVADGGLETDLIFRRGIDLECFAAFPLLDTEHGRSVLIEYWSDYVDIAHRAGAALVLETPTWRANPDWGARLGYDAAALDRVNRFAVEFLADLRDRFGVESTIGATLGPRGDGYDPATRIDPDEAAEYHLAQLESVAAAGAELATAYTLTTADEAIGVVRAARSVGLPIGISFTVETDGRLPDGTTLAAAITTVDAAAPPDHFGVNCAHPTHIRPGVEDGAPWRDRIRIVHANASRKSHAELDEADELDAGDPAELAASFTQLVPLLPSATVLGGCCGTDARHVAAIWDV